MPNPTLLFLAFSENSKENHKKKARISSGCRTPKILEGKGKNAPNRKEFLEKEKGKENHKGKEKKINVPNVYMPFPAHMTKGEGLMLKILEVTRRFNMILSVRVARRQNEAAPKSL